MAYSLTTQTIGFKPYAISQLERRDPAQRSIGDVFGSRSKFFRPRPQFNVRRPGAAVLPVKLEIRLRDRVGIKAAVRTAGCDALRTSRAADSAIDHHLCDVDILWLQLASHALDQTGQTHLAHREGG